MKLYGLASVLCYFPSSHKSFFIEVTVLIKMLEYLAKWKPLPARISRFWCLPKQLDLYQWGRLISGQVRIGHLLMEHTGHLPLLCFHLSSQPCWEAFAFQACFTSTKNNFSHLFIFFKYILVLICIFSTWGGVAQSHSVMLWPIWSLRVGDLLC